MIGYGHRSTRVCLPLSGLVYFGLYGSASALLRRRHGRHLSLHPFPSSVVAVGTTVNTPQAQLSIAAVNAFGASAMSYGIGGGAGAELHTYTRHNYISTHLSYYFVTSTGHLVAGL